MESADFKHIPVLLDECINLLEIKPSGTYVDGTLGGAGHSSVILNKLGEGGLLVGIDRDSDALSVATERLSRVKTAGRFITVKSNYSEMDTVLSERGIDGADGVLLDIGVSSYQFDSPERGFSYRSDAPLDMRMDKESSKSAYDVVNTYDRGDLIRILRDYGEEKNAVSIANKIVSARQTKPIETTFELVEIVKSAVPKKLLYMEGHPAKQTFQAVRIEVNGELDALNDGIKAAMNALKPGGLLVIITFHSLEDRIVKNAFREMANPCTCPPSFPVCVCGKKPLGTIVTPKPVTASEEELAFNNRAHSAKVRAFRKGV